MSPFILFQLSQPLASRTRTRYSDSHRKLRDFRIYIVDMHDHPVIDPAWALYAKAIKRYGTLRAAKALLHDSKILKRKSC